MPHSETFFRLNTVGIEHERRPNFKWDKQTGFGEIEYHQFGERNKVVQLVGPVKWNATLFSLDSRPSETAGGVTLDDLIYGRYVLL